MAALDWNGFAADVRAALNARGWSFAAACAARPGLDKAMLSRARAGQALSAANYLTLCDALDLDPRARLTPGRPRLTLTALARKYAGKQPVTVPVSREAEATP